MAARTTRARLEAELYALTHRGSPGDVEFYADICRGATSILELGCGYGRIIAALAAPRRHIAGLDLDPELLALAKHGVRQLSAVTQRSVQLVRGDMRTFSFEPTFDRMLLPYNGLYCLLTKRDVLSCFRSAREALAPGGRFVFDVWNAAGFQREIAASSGFDEPGPLVTLRHARRTWDVFERSRVRRASQRLEVTYDYVPREGGSSIRIPIAQRYYLATELTELLERAGFVVEHRYGDFSGSRFTARSPQLLVVARAIHG